MARNPKKATRPRPRTVEVPTKSVLNDWKQKQAMASTFKALKKEIGTQANLQVPLRRLEKDVQMLLRFGIFESTLRKLGAKKES